MRDSPCGRLPDTLHRRCNHMTVFQSMVCASGTRRLWTIVKLRSWRTLIRRTRCFGHWRLCGQQTWPLYARRASH